MNRGNRSTVKCVGSAFPHRYENPYAREVRIRHETEVAHAKAWKLFSRLGTLLGGMSIVGSFIYGCYFRMSGDDTAMLCIYSFLAAGALAGIIAWGRHERQVNKIG